MKGCIYGSEHNGTACKQPQKHQFLQSIYKTNFRVYMGNLLVSLYSGESFSSLDLTTSCLFDSPNGEKCRHWLASYHRKCFFQIVKEAASFASLEDTMGYLIKVHTQVDLA